MKILYKMIVHKITNMKRTRFLIHYDLYLRRYNRIAAMSHWIGPRYNAKP